MARLQMLICDYCGSRREESTKDWWDIYVEEKELHIVHHYPASKDDKNICSVECVGAMVKRWCYTGQLDEQPTQGINAPNYLFPITSPD